MGIRAHKPRVFPPGIGSDWRRNRILRNGQWVLDTRRACEGCGRGFRECACFDVRPCALDVAAGVA